MCGGCMRFRLWTALCAIALLTSAHAGDNKRPADDVLKKSYLDLFEWAEQPKLSAAEIQSMRDDLKRGQEVCVNRFKQKASQYGKEIEQAQKQLKDDRKPMPDAQRHDLH